MNNFEKNVKNDLHKFSLWETTWIICKNEQKIRQKPESCGFLSYFEEFKIKDRLLFTGKQNALEQLYNIISLWINYSAQLTYR